MSAFMIAKDHVAPATQDRFQRAGDDAERQMAFYLKRAFADDPGVYVFHNLRLEADGDAAQIDHLVLHRSGAIIIESKSVTSAVRINERDEWSREWNGRWTGMPSPVLQARRQADFLRKTLRARREELLSKAVFGLVQRGFGMFVFDVVVAISDQGVVQYRGQLPEVRKADQVVDRVRELIREQTGLASPLSKDPRAKEWGMTLRPEEFTRTSAFLRASHRDRVPTAEPVTPPQAVPEAKVGGRHQPVKRQDGGQSYLAVGPVNPSKGVSITPKSAIVPGFTCQKCQGERLEVAYGKYGYYFKCLTCEGNTRIEVKCQTCQGKTRTRKERQQFFAECMTCGTSHLYFTNLS